MMNEELESKWTLPNSIDLTEAELVASNYNGFESRWRTGYAANDVQLLFDGRYAAWVLPDARTFLFDTIRRRACGYLEPPVATSSTSHQEPIQIQSICEFEVETVKYVSIIYVPRNCETLTSRCVFYKVPDCTVARTIALSVRVSTAALVSRIAQRWLDSRLAPVLRIFHGFLIIGTEHGAAYILDLASDLLTNTANNRVIEVDDEAPMISEADSDPERLTALRARLVSRCAHGTVELRTEASARRRTTSGSGVTFPAVSCVTWLSRIGCVLLGFANGRVELHRVVNSRWPMLERVSSVASNVGFDASLVSEQDLRADTAVFSATLQEPTDDPRAVCFVTVLSAPFNAASLNHGSNIHARQLDLAVLQLGFARRVATNGPFEAESQVFYEKLETMNIVLRHNLATISDTAAYSVSLQHVVAFSERAALLGDASTFEDCVNRNGEEDTSSKRTNSVHSMSMQVDGFDCNASSSYLLAICFLMHHGVERVYDERNSALNSPRHEKSLISGVAANKSGVAASPQRNAEASQWFFSTSLNLNKSARQSLGAVELQTSTETDAESCEVAPALLASNTVRTELRVTLFDLDGWYKAHMPGSAGSTFLLERSITHANLRACRFEPRSVLRYGNAQAPVGDELCSPGALSFVLRLVSQHRRSGSGNGNGPSLELKAMRVDSQQGCALRSLCDRGLLDAARRGDRLIDSLGELGLLSALGSCSCAIDSVRTTGKSNSSSNLRIDALLSALHENGALWLAERFIAQACNSGLLLRARSTVSDNEIDAVRLADNVLDWALRRVESLCSSLDALCGLLFECPASFGEVDCSLNVRFELHVRLLDELQVRILHRFDQQPNTCVHRSVSLDSPTPDALHAALTALRLRVHFYKLIGLFSRFGLLHASHQLDQLAAFYHSRRSQSAATVNHPKVGDSEDEDLLFIDRFVRECDAECDGALSSSLAENGRRPAYPPTSLRGLLNAFLNPMINRHTLNAIVAYLLADLACCVTSSLPTNRNASDSGDEDPDAEMELERRVADCYKVFCASSCDTNGGLNVRVIETCWLLDHRRYEEAAESLRVLLLKQGRSQWLEHLQRGALVQLVLEAGRVDLARSLLAMSTLTTKCVRSPAQFDTLVRAFLHCALHDDITPRYVDISDLLSFVRRFSVSAQRDDYAFDRFISVFFSALCIVGNDDAISAASSRLAANRGAFVDALIRAALTDNEHAALDRFIATKILGAGSRGVVATGSGSRLLDEALFDSLMTYYVRMRDIDRLAMLNRSASYVRRAAGRSLPTSVSASSADQRRLLRKYAERLRYQVPVSASSRTDLNSTMVGEEFLTHCTRSVSVKPSSAARKRSRLQLFSLSANARRLLAPPSTPAQAYTHAVGCANAAIASPAQSPNPKRLLLSSRRSPASGVGGVRNRLAATLGSSPHVSFLNVSQRVTSAEPSPVTATPNGARKRAFFSQSRRLDESLGTERRTVAFGSIDTQKPFDLPLQQHGQHAMETESNDSHYVDEEVEAGEDLAPMETESQTGNEDLLEEDEELEEEEEDAASYSTMQDGMSVASADSACFSPNSSIGNCECGTIAANANLSMLPTLLNQSHAAHFTFAMPTAVALLPGIDISQLIEDDDAETVSVADDVENAGECGMQQHGQVEDRNNECFEVHSEAQALDRTLTEDDAPAETEVNADGSASVEPQQQSTEAQAEVVSAETYVIELRSPQSIASDSHLVASASKSNSTTPLSTHSPIVTVPAFEQPAVINAEQQSSASIALFGTSLIKSPSVAESEVKTPVGSSISAVDTSRSVLMSSNLTKTPLFTNLAPTNVQQSAVSSVAKTPFGSSASAVDSSQTVPMGSILTKTPLVTNLASTNVQQSAVLNVAKTPFGSSASAVDSSRSVLASSNLAKTPLFTNLASTNVQQSALSSVKTPLGATFAVATSHEQLVASSVAPTTPLAITTGTNLQPASSSQVLKSAELQQDVAQKSARRSNNATPTFLFAQPTIMSPQPVPVARATRARAARARQPKPDLPATSGEVAISRADAEELQRRAHARAAARSPPRTRSRARALATVPVPAAEPQPQPVLNQDTQMQTAATIANPRSQRKGAAHAVAEPSAPAHAPLPQPSTIEMDTGDLPMKRTTRGQAQKSVVVVTETAVSKTRVSQRGGAAKKTIDFPSKLTEAATSSVPQVETGTSRIATRSKKRT